MQITKNFNSSELECPCCTGLIYEQSFIERCQILRTLMNIPFYISPGGGYRCRIYNDSLKNSAKNSQHLHGRAMDVGCDGWVGAQKWQFVNEALKLGMSVGVYSNFFHIDLRPGTPVFFYGTY